MSAFSTPLVGYVNSTMTLGKAIGLVAIVGFAAVILFGRVAARNPRQDACRLRLKDHRIPSRHRVLQLANGWPQCGPKPHRSSNSARSTKQSSANYRALLQHYS
jgi:hypothetical protein